MIKGIIAIICVIILALVISNGIFSWWARINNWINTKIINWCKKHLQDRSCQIDTLNKKIIFEPFIAPIYMAFLSRKQNLALSILIGGYKYKTYEKTIMHWCQLEELIKKQARVDKSILDIPISKN